MICLDSSAWIEIFRGGPRKDAFLKLLNEAEGLVVPTICMVEVGRVIRRDYGSEVAEAYIGQMAEHDVVALETSGALDAVRTEGGKRLHLADSIIYSTSRRREAVLVTMDEDFKGLEGVKYFSKS